MSGVTTHWGNLHGEVACVAGTVVDEFGRVGVSFGQMGLERDQRESWRLDDGSFVP